MGQRVAITAQLIEAKTRPRYGESYDRDCRTYREFRVRSPGPLRVKSDELPHPQPAMRQ